MHASLPGGYHPDEQKAYFEVLVEVARFYNAENSKRLAIVFDENDLTAVEKILE